MAWKLPPNKRDVYTILAETGAIPAGTWKVGAPLPTFIKPSGYTHTNVTTLKYCGGYRGAVLAFGQNATSGSGTDASLPEYANRFGIGATADRNVATFTQDAGATKTLGYYAVSDPDITSGGTQGTFQVRRELVYGSGASTTFTLARVPSRIVGTGSGQGHSYGASSYLIPIDAYASYNVSISNLTIDGNGTYPNTLCRFWFVDNLTLTDCTFRYFFAEGCSTYFCRNILRNRCHVEYSNGDSGGEGYCHADYATYNTETRDCTYRDRGLTTMGLRHAHYTAFGVSNKLQDGCSATDTYDQSQTTFWEVGSHVGPDNDCKMIDQSHTGIGGGISFGGHQLFGWGSTGVIATNCDANGRLGILALGTSGTATNVQNLDVVYLIGCHDRDDVGAHAETNPENNDGPTDFTFDACEFRQLVTSAAFPNNAGAALTFGAHWLGGTITLKDCTNIQTGDAQNWDLRSENNFTLAINGGTYRNTGGTVYRMFDLGNGTAGEIALTLAGNITFDHQSGGGTREAFRLFGTGTVTNNATSISWNLAGSVDFMLDSSGTWTGEIADPS